MLILIHAHALSARECLRLAAALPRFGFACFPAIVLRDRANACKRRTSLLIGDTGVLLVAETDRTVLEEVSYRSIKSFGPSAGMWRVMIKIADAL